MRKSRPKSAYRICVLSSHPLLLKQLQELLSKSRVPMKVRTLELAGRIEAINAPRARVYVIDAHAHAQVTEALIGRILNRYPRARFLVLAERFTEPNAFPLLRLGVKGLLDYGQAARQLPAAVEAVASGGFWVPRILLSRFMDSVLSIVRTHRLMPSPADMSPREQEILEGLLENLSNKEIANKVHISERTVKFHVSNLLGKFGVQRRTDLILLYLQRTRVLYDTVQ